MPSRRWLTAWRLFRSGEFKELFIRILKVFADLVSRETEINYLEWRKTWVELDVNEKSHFIELVNSLSDDPSFALIVSANQMDSASLFSTVENVIAQLYPNWVLHILDTGQIDDGFFEKISALNDNRLKLTDSLLSVPEDWIIELASGTELHEAALSISAISIVKNPEAVVIYSDHDHINISGEFCDPHMKPDWNADLLTSMNYLAPLVICKKELWEANLDKRTDQHVFLLEITKELSHETILHVPCVLASVQILDDKSHLEPSVQRVKHPLPVPVPFVSILIPSRDQGQLLKKCLNSLYKETSYKHYEIVLVDHETSEPRAIEIIEGFKENENFRVINFSGSFNFAAMMNQAAEFSNGQILVLLNNDTEIIDSEWLTELVTQVARPEVGIAGALLLFGDRTIQHAGVHPGLGGLMGHGHKHFSGDSSGYFNRLKTVHEVAAVTGACLAIEKSTWVDLEGLDEENLHVAYNDIDLCFKVRNNGLRVVFTPYAKLLHHESLSRGVDQIVEKNQRLQNELRTMHERWGEFLKIDPAYSPNLSLDGGGFTLNKNPTITKKMLF